MTLRECGQVLAKIAVFENRTFSDEAILAWHEILGDVALEDALIAVTNHYKGSTEAIKPAHVFRGARDAKDERKKVRVN